MSETALRRHASWRESDRLITRSFRFALAEGHASTIALVAAYAVIYAFLIIRGDGIPFVMDNNETFAALNHAFNLWSFDFHRSFGLPDEAVSPWAAAHPVVHTHQGDFPRLYALLLYALGARDVTSQIWITTFTIGLASLLMAKSFFRRLAGDLYATIAVAMLMTDYLLFAQWQVNIYRVWHGFFLFAAFNCAAGLATWKRSRWLIATVATYAGLLYWELVFAAFVAVMVATYTIWTYRNSFRLIFIAGTAQAFGAFIGLAVLIAQLLLYLGWNDMIADLAYTYSARNLGADPQAFLTQVSEFYQRHNILFWENFQSNADFSGFANFTKAIFGYVLQVQTPLLVLFLLALAGAGFLADSRLPRKTDVDVAAPAIAFASSVILTFGLYAFLLPLVIVDRAIEGALPVFHTMTDEPLLLLPLHLSIFVLALSVSALLRRFSAALSLSGTQPGIRRCTIAAIYLYALGEFPLLQENVYIRNDEALWLGLLTPVTGWEAKLCLAGVALIGVLLILTGKRAMLGTQHTVPASLARFLVCGLLGYLFVYATSAGYLYSGYFGRACPFLVFHVDALLALGVFVPLAIARNLMSRLELSRSLRIKNPLALCSAAASLGLLAYWGTVQLRYLDILPPNQLAFAKTLRSIAAPTDGLVSNTYAVPFGLMANTWAFMDYDFSNRQFGRRQGDPKAAKGNNYLWLADRATNDAYQHPRLFVCFQPLGFYSGLLDPANPRPYRVRRCSDTAIDAASGQSGQNSDTYPKVTRLMRDEKNDLWAVYRLDWRTTP